jgi:hypothetical protein
MNVDMMVNSTKNKYIRLIYNYVIRKCYNNKK